MVHFVEGFLPISQEIDNVALEDEVDDGYQSMGAGGARKSILTRIIVLGDIVEETLNISEETFK